MILEKIEMKKSEKSNTTIRSSRNNLTIYK